MYLKPVVAPLVSSSYLLQQTSLWNVLGVHDRTESSEGGFDAPSTERLHTQSASVENNQRQHVSLDSPVYSQRHFNEASAVLVCL